MVHQTRRCRKRLASPAPSCLPGQSLLPKVRRPGAQLSLLEGVTPLPRARVPLSIAAAAAQVLKERAGAVSSVSIGTQLCP